MSRHFKHLGELKTLLETKKVANEGILVLDKYRDRSEVIMVLATVTTSYPLIDLVQGRQHYLLCLLSLSLFAGSSVSDSLC